MSPEGAYARVLRSAPRFELAPEDSGYPRRLADLGSKAPVIYGVGSPETLGQDCLSVIGARKATPYGLACAGMAGRIAAECGVCVVSGGAVGCDSRAARAALDAGGTTVVIPGCGADLVYPKTSDELFADAVVRGGCVLSMERWGTKPARYTFVRRNSLIAALSQSLVVCEAGRPSGTFSTAMVACDLGRRVYAVPGSIFSPTSRGTNWLIEAGAAPVCDEASLEGLVALDYGRLRMSDARMRGSRGKLMDALVASPLDVTQVAGLLACTVPEAMGTLAELEAAGAVCRLIDGRFTASETELVGHNTGS